MAAFGWSRGGLRLPILQAICMWEQPVTNLWHPSIQALAADHANWLLEWTKIVLVLEVVWSHSCSPGAAAAWSIRMWTDREADCSHYSPMLLLVVLWTAAAGAGRVDTCHHACSEWPKTSHSETAPSPAHLIIAHGILNKENSTQGHFRSKNDMGRLNTFSSCIIIQI